MAPRGKRTTGAAAASNEAETRFRETVSDGFVAVRQRGDVPSSPVVGFGKFLTETVMVCWDVDGSVRTMKTDAGQNFDFISARDHRTQRIEQIVRDLRGTCQSIPEVLEDGEEDDADFEREMNEAIDSELFRCARCDWWCEDSERHDEVSERENEDICDDCGDSA